MKKSEFKALIEESVRKVVREELSFILSENKKSVQDPRKSVQESKKQPVRSVSFDPDALKNFLKNKSSENYQRVDENVKFENQVIQDIKSTIENSAGNEDFKYNAQGLDSVAKALSNLKKK